MGFQGFLRRLRTIISPTKWTRSPWEKMEKYTQCTTTKFLDKINYNPKNETDCSDKKLKHILYLNISVPMSWSTIPCTQTRTRAQTLKQDTVLNKVNTKWSFQVHDNLCHWVTVHLKTRSKRGKISAKKSKATQNTKVPVLKLAIFATFFPKKQRKLFQKKRCGSQEM